MPSMGSTWRWKGIHEADKKEVIDNHYKSILNKWWGSKLERTGLMRDIGKEGKIKNFFARQNSIFKRGVTQKDIKFKKEHDRYSNNYILLGIFHKKVKCISR